MTAFDKILHRVQSNDPTLTSFNFAETPVDDLAIECLVKAMQSNTNLKRIVIHGDFNTKRGPCYTCGFNEKNWHAHKGQLSLQSIRLLANCPVFEEVDFSNNPIGDEGAIILAQSRTIKVLRLNNCNIKIDGAMAFLTNNFIEDLFLVGNKFDQDANDWIGKINKKLDDNKSRSSPAMAMQISTQRNAELLDKAVLEAIAKGDIPKLVQLIPQLPQGVNTHLIYGCNLLLYSIDVNQPLVAQFLLDAGALLETDERNYTPLVTASENGREAMVQLLLDYGANITGEFYFNQEDALTVACFKFNSILFAIIATHPTCTDNLILPVRKTKDAYMAQWKAFSDYAYQNGSPWIMIADHPELLFDNTYRALTLLNNLRKANVPQIINAPAELFHYANIYRLLHDKLAVLKKNRPPFNTKMFEVETLTEEQRVRQTRPITSIPVPSQSLTEQQLQTQLVRLNQVLQQGDDDGLTSHRSVNWADFPKLFVAQYRGIHYYQHYFDERQRMDHERTCHLNRLAPAPAVYAMSELNPKEQQLLRETDALRHRGAIVKTFQAFDQTPPVQYKGATYSSVGTALQQHMSNEYRGYQRDIEQAANPHTRILAENRMFGYPHFATSDLPEHALRYAYGKKAIPGLVEHRLLPNYDPQGKPQHPYLGKIFLCLLSPLMLREQYMRHVLGQHNRREFQLKDQVAPERESGATGGMDAECLFYEECISLPDFSVAYRDTDLQIFGFDMQRFNYYKLALQHPNSANRNKIIEDLTDEIIAHKRKALLQVAHAQAIRLGGHLIYCNSSTQYGLSPEPILRSDGARYTPQWEQKLMQEQTHLNLTAALSKKQKAPSSSSSSSQSGQGKSEQDFSDVVPMQTTSSSEPALDDVSDSKKEIEAGPGAKRARK